jgi:hypothetical protein
MQVLYTRCAGLDVHKDTIVACVRCVSPPMHQEVRSFGTTTAELLKLRSQLAFDADGSGQLQVPTNGLFGAGPIGGNAKSMDLSEGSGLEGALIRRT